jgi:transposase
MARALSLDLRERVVESVTKGMSCRQAAVRVWCERIECDPLGRAGSRWRRTRADEARRRSQVATLRGRGSSFSAQWQSNPI